MSTVPTACHCSTIGNWATMAGGVRHCLGEKFNGAGRVVAVWWQHEPQAGPQAGVLAVRRWWCVAALAGTAERNKLRAGTGRLVKGQSQGC